MARKTEVSKAGQARVGAKVAHLVGGDGELPNTAAGRNKALGMAYGMEEAGRLGPRGAYRAAHHSSGGRPEPAARRPYTPPSAAVPRPAPAPKKQRRWAPGVLPDLPLPRTSRQLPRMAKGGVVKHTKAHPGFKAVQAGIAKNITPRVKGQSKSEAAGAILASSSRHASAAAHKANPRLNRVKG